MTTKFNNKLITITAPSGAGKTTLARNCFDIEHTIISCTTRAPREGERDGIDYYFITREQAEELKANHETLEYTEYNGNIYCYTKEEFKKLEHGDCVIICTIEGLRALLSYPQLAEIIVPVFLKIDKQNMEARLAERNDGEDKMKQRIALYEKEAANEAIIAKLPHSVIINVSNNSQIDTVDDFHKMVLDKLK